MKDSIRAFIAIDIPEHIRAFLKNMQDDLKQAGSDVKWVTPENLHLTLKFLGNINDEQRARAEEILSTVATRHTKIPAMLDRLGTFPPHGRPRVLWAGLDDKQKHIRRLADHLADKLQKTGFPKEDRAFQSHITLGRIRSGKNLKALTQTLEEITLPPDLHFTVEQITFHQSTLGPTGPRYQVLKEFGLT